MYYFATTLFFFVGMTPQLQDEIGIVQSCVCIWYSAYTVVVSSYVHCISVVYLKFISSVFFCLSHSMNLYRDHRVPLVVRIKSLYITSPYITSPYITSPYITSPYITSSYLLSKLSNDVFLSQQKGGYGIYPAKV